MSDRTTGLLYIGALLVLSFAFQYQMKVLAGEIAPILSRPTDVIDKVHGLSQASAAWRLPVVLALAALLFSFWLLALMKLDLSVALPLASVALVVNAVGTGLLLGEGLGILRIGGVVTVAAGIVMVLKS
jgi:multidrug transporter EmrE-like cation transporter